MLYRLKKLSRLVDVFVNKPVQWFMKPSLHNKFDHNWTKMTNNSIVISMRVDIQ